MKPQDFIALIGGAAKASAKLSSVPASFTVAQAALESAWGESMLARQGKNLFGVKADLAWQGDVLTINTREFLHGTWVMVPARWRKYTDWQACMDDHAAFLHQNRRYAACLLKATPPEQRTDVKPTEHDKKTSPMEQIVKLEKETSVFLKRKMEEYEALKVEIAMLKSEIEKEEEAKISSPKRGAQ